MKLGHTTPILRIFDLAKAKEFYVDFLGFTIDWEHRFGENFPVYLQVSRDDCVLHLSEHHGDTTPGSRVIIAISGIEDFHRELSERGYRYLKPAIEDTEWGSRVMTLTDPFGNRLTFSQSKE